MPDPSIVRHATQADEEALFDALHELHRIGMGAPFPYSFDKAMSAIQFGTRGKGGIIGVIDAPNRPGYIAATVGLVLDEWWWSKCNFLVERWLFVRSEYRRGTGYGDALKAWCEDIRLHFEKNAQQKEPFILEASFVQRDPRRRALMDRFYGKWGRRVGGIYVSGVPDLRR